MNFVDFNNEAKKFKQISQNTNRRLIFCVKASAMLTLLRLTFKKENSNDINIWSVENVRSNIVATSRNCGMFEYFLAFGQGITATNERANSFLFEALPIFNAMYYNNVKLGDLKKELLTNIFHNNYSCDKKSEFLINDEIETHIFETYNENNLSFKSCGDDKNKLYNETLSAALVYVENQCKEILCDE